MYFPVKFLFSKLCWGKISQSPPLLGEGPVKSEDIRCQPILSTGGLTGGEYRTSAHTMSDKDYNENPPNLLVGEIETF